MNSNEKVDRSPAPDGSGRNTSRRRYLRWLLPLVIVLIGILAAVALVATRPHARRARPPAMARLVQVKEAEFSARKVVIEANGTVGASREVSLFPRVTGEVTSISPDFLPGGTLAAGDLVLTIDPEDYELVLKQRESDLARARAAYDIELGRQEIARQEFALLGEEMAENDRSLVLRVPQLDQAEADLQSARASVEQARLNLDRTRVESPFNAVVRTRDVVEGTQVSAGTRLGSLVGSDEYWIEVVLPVDRLGWIEVPAENGDRGSPVRIYDASAWSDGAWREGRVLKLAADVEEQGRMARLIVAVPDPLALSAQNAGFPALMLGGYVRVEILGGELESAAELDRDMLRDGDNVWVMNADGELEIRPVTVAYRGRETVMVTSGIAAGERMVVTDIAAAVSGMKLRAEGDVPEPAAAGSNKAEGRVRK